MAIMVKCKECDMILYASQYTQHHEYAYCYKCYDQLSHHNQQLQDAIVAAIVAWEGDEDDNIPIEVDRMNEAISQCRRALSSEPEAEVK